MTLFRTLTRAGLAALTGLTLVACSGGTEQSRGQLATLIEVREAVRANRAAQNPERPQVTRDLINRIGLPLIEIDLKSRDVTGYFLLDSVRGPAQIWQANDGGQVILRGGLVTATRGIGNDLRSSSYAATLKAIQHGTGTAQRQYDLTNGLGTQDSIVLSCVFTRQGTETLTIYGLQYHTHRVQERCRSEAGEEIVNDYWIEQGRPLIRQSRQWISPELGHFNLRFLNAPVT